MMGTSQISDLTAEELRQAVAARYGQVACDPSGPFTFPVGRAFAEAFGYPPATLDALPAAAIASFAGVTNLPLWTAFTPGEVVVDLGCGAGLDTLIASRTVGETGHVHAIDLSEAMVELARANAREAGLANVEVHQ